MYVTKKSITRVVCLGAVSYLALSVDFSSPSYAQSQPNLPAVNVDAPQQRARATRQVRSRGTAQRSVRVAPPQPNQQPVAPTTTMGTTRTIGAPPPPYAGGQIAQGGTLGLLGTANVMNVPFSTVNYTSQLIENQQGRTAADTLINDASVRVTTATNGFDDSLQIRGFAVPSGDVGFNGLYGLVSSNRVPSQIIDRIELLKGPGALINGIAPGNSVGGGVNIVSKRALEIPFTRLTPIFMSSGNYGLHLETSRRFGDNKEWGVRFNGLGRNGEASINDGNWQTGLGALSLDYRGERFRWTLDAISQNDETKNYRPQIGFPNLTTVPAPPDARSNWYPGTTLSQKDNTIASGAEYDLTEWLTAYAGVGYREGEIRQTFPDSRVTATGTNPLPPGIPNSNGVFNAAGDFRVNNGYFDSYSKTASGNVGLRSRFETGFIRHSINVAYTGFEQENGSRSTTNPLLQSIPSNLYNPSALPPITPVRLPPGKTSAITLKSVAASDTMSFLNDRVFVTGGARYQMVRQDAFSNVTGLRTSSYDSDATSPLGGVVIKPFENVSVYANYAEGLSQGSIVGPGFANTGAILAPFVSKQKEAGVKVDWGTITTTAAVFTISRPNLITTPANVRAYDGEQVNRGVELNAYGEIQRGLRGTVSYTYLRPEVTKAQNFAEVGKDALGVPRTRVSAGLDWDVPGVSGLSLNGRVIYTSSAFINTLNTVSLPDWTRYDIGARYATAIGGRPVTFRANIENLFDKNYWLTSGTFQTVAAPRTYIVSAAFDF